MQFDDQLMMINFDALFYSRLEINVGKCFVLHKTNRGKYLRYIFFGNRRFVTGELHETKVQLAYYFLETQVEIGESIRGKDVYIVQTGTK